MASRPGLWTFVIHWDENQSFAPALANALDRTIIFDYIILVFVFYGVLKASIAVCLNLNLNTYDV